ncbi:MAG TPA: hypothetical protein VNN07_15920, partial [Candidatus Tectomicrobia bacterium]|nr:hypothetical protein [Candidatus Tectomicrobia bacterium]
MSTAVSVDRQPRAGTRVDRRPIVLAAVASVMGGAVYLNALPNPFVLDDHLTVVTNPSIRDPWNIAEVVRGSLFRPVENMSFAVDHALWGFDPFGFHLTSLLLHVVNVALVFALAWRVHVDRGGVDDGARALGAFVAAALFAVHPLMTEAVGYVSGRAELLGAAFFVLALVLLRDGIVGGGRVRLASALLALCLALGSKETAAMFPLVALAYDRLLLREVPSRRYRL